MILQEKESVLGLQFHAIRYSNVLSADKTLFNPLLLQSPCFETLSLSHLLFYRLFICGTFPSFFFLLYLWLIVSLSIPLLFCCLIQAHSFTLDLLCTLTLILLCFFFLHCRDIDSFVEKKKMMFSLSLSLATYFLQAHVFCETVGDSSARQLQAQPRPRHATR